MSKLRYRLKRPGTLPRKTHARIHDGGASGYGNVGSLIKAPSEPHVHTVEAADHEIAAFPSKQLSVQDVRAVVRHECAEVARRQLA